MANKKEQTPKTYDRWEKTCVKFTDAPKKQTAKKTNKASKSK